MQLGLGAAQFGLDYGISNEAGKVRFEEVRRIMDLATAAGISIVDTAPAYGNSESSIGTAIRGRSGFRVITKTPIFSSQTIGETDAHALKETFYKSRETLGGGMIHGLLFHRADDILKSGGRFLVDAARELVDSGVLEKVGVSVYTGSQIDQVLKVFRPDIVQAPLNVFDQRLVVSGHLERLKSLGSEVHLRSVFLQGLLLMDLGRIPQYFAPFMPHVTRYFDALNAAHVSKLEAALNFVATLKHADAILVGVTRAEELNEIIKIFNSGRVAKIDYQCFASNDTRLLDPSCWQLEA